MCNKIISVKIKIVTAVFIGVIAFGAQAQRQSILKTNQEVLGYQNIPQETIFVHYNTTLLFAGEYLYYSVYCFKANDHQPSEISKVGYVVLLNEQGEAVFEHKVQLIDGRGQGDFFIPVSIPSGNYKLIAYTQWMLNAKNHFFQDDISVLNPYQGNQKNITSDPFDSSKDTSTTVSNPPKSTPFIGTIGDEVVISFDQEHYKRRSPVQLTMDAKNVFKGGNYSLSVRRKDIFKKSSPLRSDEFYKNRMNTTKVNSMPKSTGSAIFLPEMRGELIYGKIQATDPSFPVNKQKVGMSRLENKKDIKIATTDKEGNFVFNLNKRNNENDVFIEVMGEGKENYTITIDEIPEIAYSDLVYYKFEISSSLKNTILERSIQNQIENSYYRVKPDTIQEFSPTALFSGEKLQLYNLDDYTRFPTVKETIVEVVEGVATRRNDEGEQIFKVRGPYSNNNRISNVLPLLIVDGVMMQEHDEVVNYDARKVQYIGFIQDRYYVGAKMFEGVVLIETIGRDYFSKQEKQYGTPISLSNLQAEKKYFKQYYDTTANTYDRIPDYRRQLLWKPKLTLDQGTNKMIFFTSDVPGKYEAAIEGFTKEGKPVSVRQEFSVEE